MISLKMYPCHTTQEMESLQSIVDKLENYLEFHGIAANLRLELEKEGKYLTLTLHALPGSCGCTENCLCIDGYTALSESICVVVQDFFMESLDKEWEKVFHAIRKIRGVGPLEYKGSSWEWAWAPLEECPVPEKDRSLPNREYRSYYPSHRVVLAVCYSPHNLEVSFKKAKESLYEEGVVDTSLEQEFLRDGTDKDKADREKFLEEAGIHPRRGYDP